MSKVDSTADREVSLPPITTIEMNTTDVKDVNNDMASSDLEDGVHESRFPVSNERLGSSSSTREPIIGYNPKTKRAVRYFFGYPEPPFIQLSTKNFDEKTLKSILAANSHLIDNEFTGKGDIILDGEKVVSERKKVVQPDPTAAPGPRKEDQENDPLVSVVTLCAPAPKAKRTKAVVAASDRVLRTRKSQAVLQPQRQEAVVSLINDVAQATHPGPHPLAMTRQEIYESIRRHADKIGKIRRPIVPLRRSRKKGGN